MIGLLVAATAAFGLILFVAFIASRLVRSRSKGISIRMQMFLAIAVIVGTFAFGLGLLVLDRIEARATLLAESAASDQASAIAALLASEMETREQGLDELARRIGRARRGGTPELHLSIVDPEGRELFSEGPRPPPRGTCS